MKKARFVKIEWRRFKLLKGSHIFGIMYIMNKNEILYVVYNRFYLGKDEKRIRGKVV